MHTHHCRLAILVLILLAISGAAHADTLALKQQFPFGWRYSTDGQHFTTIWFKATGLREMMAEDSVALEHLRQFENLQNMSQLTIIAGGVLGGFMLAEAINDTWDKDEHLAPTIGAGAALIVSGMLERLSAEKLKAAVSLYNDAHRETIPDITFMPLPPPNGAGFAAGIAVRF